jgi:hypothetical protein
MSKRPSNLTSVNEVEITANQAPSFFNNFYQPTYAVSQNVDDAVLAFFEKITDGREAAKIMASSVIYTSLAQNIDPMETLQKFSTMASDDLNSYVAMFLNLNRLGTSYLGINNRPKTGKYVARMIRP